MSELTFGLIGAGMIGGAHARALSEIDGVTIKYLADVRPEPAKKLAEATGIEQVVEDYKVVLADKAVDAVVICTPPWLHYQMALDAIAAGKQVLCEKPFAHAAAAGQEMVDAAEKAGVVLADCSARHARLQPTYRTVKALIDDGKLGDVYLIKHHGRGRRGRPGIEYHPEAKWFLDRSKAVGGIAIDWGVYDFSLMFGLLGDSVEVTDVLGFAHTGVDNVDVGDHVFDVEEHGGGAIRLSNGVMILWERASACHMDTGSETRIFGTRGGVKFEAWNRQAPSLTYYHDVVDGLPVETNVPIKGQDKHGGDHPHIDRDFVAALREGREPMMPGRNAVKVLKAIEAIYQSAGVA